MGLLNFFRRGLPALPSRPEVLFQVLVNGHTRFVPVDCGDRVPAIGEHVIPAGIHGPSGDLAPAYRVARVDHVTNFRHWRGAASCRDVPEDGRVIRVIIHLEPSDAPRIWC